MAKILTLLLVVACALLAIAGYFKFADLDKPLAENTSTPAEVDMPAINPPRPLIERNLSDFTEVTERPLFSQTRRPDVAAIDEPDLPQVPVRQPDFTLTGVVIADGSQIALLSRKRDPKIERVKVGEKLDGWEVTEISPLKVVMISQGSQIELEMLRKSDPAQAAKLKAQLTRRNAPNTRPLTEAPEETEPFPIDPPPFEEELPEDD